MDGENLTLGYAAWSARRPRLPGAYRLTVRALGFDGQTDATPVSLTLRRR